MAEHAQGDASNLYVAILAGGVGTRLWPRSRKSLPKQFVDIGGVGRTMIQSTADRVAELVPPERIFVVTGDAYAAIAAEQLPELQQEQIVVEPHGRNTAPAIGLASITILARDPGAIIAVLPADHAVANPSRFCAALRKAASLARCGWLTTLGITPTYPNTGYGYIQRGKPISDKKCDAEAFAVERFHEKPDLATAKSLIDSGECYWNGGIFVYKVSRMLDELEQHLPDISEGLEEILAAFSANSQSRLDSHSTQSTIERVWPNMTNISIDHGVMEHADKVAVVPLDAGWNDVGSWDALSALVAPDANGNIVVGDTIQAIDSTNNIVYSSNQSISLIGVQDLVIVSTGDCLLVGPKDQMQRVKEVVEQLRAGNREDLL